MNEHIYNPVIVSNQPVLKEPAVLKELIKDIEDMHPQVNLTISGGSPPKNETNEFGKDAPLI